MAYVAARLPTGDRSSGLKAAGTRCRSAELHGKQKLGFGRGSAATPGLIGFSSCRLSALGRRRRLWLPSFPGGSALALSASLARRRR
jgi:hypothetical protein